MPKLLSIELKEPEFRALKIAIRNQALEEAARLCDADAEHNRELARSRWGSELEYAAAGECVELARKIRELKIQTK